MIDKNIGFIGLGNLGSKLANSIILADYNLYVYDLEKETLKLCPPGVIPGYDGMEIEI